MNIKAQISQLINLANIDGSYADQEKKHIIMIAKANGLTKEDVEQLFAKPVPLPSISTLSWEDKFEYLYNIVQLMKIDSQVFLSEIKFCENLAVKLGFKKKVISKLSKSIYSDPSITSDIESLKKSVKKFEL